MFEYLIGVGAMKAGTTTLYDLISKHPGVRVGTAKELRYFNRASEPSKEEYDALFAPGEGLKLDITPRYMFDPEAIERMSRVLDPARCAIVVLLRDPIERALSHYKMNLMQEIEPEPFDRCLELEAPRVALGGDSALRHSYFMRGLYAKQLDVIAARFPRENIKILLFEDFIKNQQATVDAVCEFARLAPFKVEPVHSNKSVARFKSKKLDVLFQKVARLLPRSLMSSPALLKLKYFLRTANQDKSYKIEITPQYLAQLKEYYREDMQRLRSEYGVDTSKWRNFRAAE